MTLSLVLDCSAEYVIKLYFFTFKPLFLVPVLGIGVNFVKVLENLSVNISVQKMLAHKTHNLETKRNILEFTQFFALASRLQRKNDFFLVFQLIFHKIDH